MNKNLTPPPAEENASLASISHDIRTPMNSIMGFAALLTREAVDPEKVRDYAKKIISSGHQIMDIIDDMLQTDDRSDRNLRKDSNMTEAAAEEDSIFNGMHVLAAEDNEINAEILVELLKIVGATCDVCENGKLAAEAFERSEPGQYQLILMDIQMPVMNGYDATRTIRQMSHPMATKIPIVAMTANALAKDIHDALDAGMDAHVAKPVNMAVLEQSVRAVLDWQSDHD